MVRNKLEVRVCGLQRSGNHAIIDWVVEQYKNSSICFLNNVRHGDYNPFDTAEQILVYNVQGFPDGRLEKVSDALVSAPKDVIIYSYEDARNKITQGISFWESVYAQDFENKRHTYLGESLDFIDILIVRDPYNFFDSRLKKIESLTGVNDIDFMIESLKHVLREAVRLEDRANARKLVVKYNQWFLDKHYRKSLSNKIGGKFSDSSLDRVPSMGGGSSFDGTSLNNNGKLGIKDLWRKREKFLNPGSYTRLRSYWDRLFLQRPQDMKVVERWKSVEDQRMKTILADSEISELSKQLFGNVLEA